MDRIGLHFGLLASALLACAGCHINPHYQPTDHQHTWDPVLGSCDACGVCGGDCVGHTPSSYTKHMLTCASGADEIYWGEWTSDPPAPCDPCDDCGNWIGPQACCPPKGLHKLWYGLLGRRDGGCLDNCGCDDCAQVAPEVWEEPILSSPETFETVPAPLPDQTPSPEARRTHRRSARHSQHPDSRLMRRTTL